MNFEHLKHLYIGPKHTLWSLNVETHQYTCLSYPQQNIESMEVDINTLVPLNALDTLTVCILSLLYGHTRIKTRHTDRLDHVGNCFVWDKIHEEWIMTSRRIRYSELIRAFHAIQGQGVAVTLSTSGNFTIFTPDRTYLIKYDLAEEYLVNQAYQSTIKPLLKLFNINYR